MIRLLANEFLKLKHSKIIWYLIFCSILSPIVVFLLAHILNSVSGTPSVTYLDYMTMVLKMIMSFVGLVLFNWGLSEILAREFKHGTIGFQLIMPISRTEFLTVKIIFASMIMLALILMNYLVGMVIACLYQFPGIHLSLTEDLFFIYLKAGILLLPTSFFSIWMVSKFRSNTIPVCLNLALALIGLVLNGHAIQVYYPWTVPYNIIYRVVGTEAGLEKSYWILTLFCIISVLKADKTLRKMNI